MPTLVVNLFHRGRPKPGLHLQEPLGSDRTGPNQPPVEADRDPPRTRVHSCPPPARAESLLPPARTESLLPPAKATNQPPQAEVGHQQPREVPSALPLVGEERVIVPGLTGTKWSCAKLVIESPSPKGLPIQLGWRRQGERPPVRFMTKWMEKSRPRTILPLRPCRPTTLGSTLRP